MSVPKVTIMTSALLNRLSLKAPRICEPNNGRKRRARSNSS